MRVNPVGDHLQPQSLSVPRVLHWVKEGAISLGLVLLSKEILSQKQGSSHVLLPPWKNRSLMHAVGESTDFGTGELAWVRALAFTSYITDLQKEDSSTHALGDWVRAWGCRQRA